MGRIPGYNEVTTNNTSDLFVCEQQESSTWKTKKTTLQKIADAIFGAKTDNNLPHYTGTPTAGSTAYEIANKVENVAFNSSTMFADISTAVKNAFSLSECYCYVLKNGNVCTVTLRFKCSSAISSGSFSIVGLTPCQTDVASALASLDNKGGYMQLSGTTLYIRCAASSSQYLAGSITYPTYTN